MRGRTFVALTGFVGAALVVPTLDAAAANPSPPTNQKFASKSSGDVKTMQPGTVTLSASQVEQGAGPAPVSTAAPTRTCRYEDRTSWARSMLPPNPGGAGGEDLARIARDEMVFVWHECTNADGTIDTGGTWTEPGDPATGGAIAPDVERAIRSLRLPGPRVAAWPALDRQVVNVETWLHVDSDTDQPVPFTAPLALSVHAGSALVTASASALDVTWTFQPDDGSAPVTRRCPGPGRVWTKGADEDAPDRCAVRFPAAQSGTVTATISYSVPWTAPNGESGVVRTEQVLSPPAPYVVRAYEAVIR